MKIENINNKEYEQIKNYIKYGIYELQRDNQFENKTNIKILNVQALIEQIINKYRKICKSYMELYLITKMDTFEKTACLFKAMNEVKIIKNDDKMNFDLLLNISLNMCAKPIKKAQNELIELEEVNYKNTLSQSTTFNLYKINKELLMHEVMEEKHKLTIKDLATTFESLYSVTRYLENKPVEKIKK